MDAQYKTLNQMDKACKELRSRVDSLTDKMHILSNKYDKGKGEGGLEGIYNPK